MKPLIILLTCLTVIVTGCDMGNMDFDFSWGDPYYPWTPDSSAVSSVLLRLSADTVVYSPQDMAEVSGYAEAMNYYGDKLGGIPLDFCVSDSNVSCVWDDVRLRDTTDANGRVGFTLRCKDCAGDVTVHVMNGWSSADVVFLPTDRQPAHLTGVAIPETVYVNCQHPDSLTLRLSVTNQENQPVPGFTVRSAYLNWELPDCYGYRARTDTAGVVTASFVHAFQVPWPYSCCFAFFAGAFRDSICVTFMPWDSTRGG